MYDNIYADFMANEHKGAWKYPEMYETCRLALEYLTLGGLEDARRGEDIYVELLELWENVK